AGSPANRAAQLRRALQSERDVLCVHPCSPTYDVAYEAAMIQGDTKRALVPILPEALHPAVVRLAGLARDRAGPGGALRLVEAERAGGEVLLDAGMEGHKPSLPGWDVLRALGGEVAEVSAFAEHEEVEGGSPLVVAGRFEKGGLFRLSLLPGERESRWRLTVTGGGGGGGGVFSPRPAAPRPPLAGGPPRQQRQEGTSAPRPTAGRPRGT